VLKFGVTGIPVFQMAAANGEFKDTICNPLRKFYLDGILHLALSSEN
jgi:hypothetical protein